MRRTTMLGLAAMALAGAATPLPAAGGYSPDRRGSRRPRGNHQRPSRPPQTPAEADAVIAAQLKRARRLARNRRVHHHHEETP